MAQSLGDLREEVVFLGGATVGLFMTDLLADETFLDALFGHLEPDAASQARIIPLTKRLTAIANII